MAVRNGFMKHGVMKACAMGIHSSCFYHDGWREGKQAQRASHVDPHTMDVAFFWLVAKGGWLTRTGLREEHILYIDAYLSVP